MSASIISGARLCCAAQRPTPGGVATLRRTSRVVVRAEPGREQSDQIADALEEGAKDIVQGSKENSGLDVGKLGQQPGNRPGGSSDASEVMSFSGLLPETINGRAAMIGMLAAFGAEVGTRQPVFQQIKTAPVLVALGFGTVILASVIPVARGADLNQNGAGPFTQRTEIWNGRLAMVAFAFLLIVESFKKAPGLVP